MIEVEKKFFIDEDVIRTVTAGAQLISEKTHTDIYFDRGEYELTTHDMWLRKRGDRFELKVAAHTIGSDINNFVELETDDEIREHLKLPPGADLENDLQSLGFTVFASLTTLRKKFKLDDFIIDIDSTTASDDFHYLIGEIELMVANESELPLANKRISDFLDQRGISAHYTQGKMLRYLYEKQPAHFQALLAVGIARPI